MRYIYKRNTFTFAFYWIILLFWIDFYAYWHTLIFIHVWEMKKSFKKFWRITLDSYRNKNIIFFRMLHKYFLSELTLISVGIPPVYTGAAPPRRHTTAASKLKLRPGPPQLRWGPAQLPKIHPGVGTDLMGVCTLVTTLSILFLVVLTALSPPALFSLPTRAAATSP